MNRFLLTLLAILLAVGSLSAVVSCTQAADEIAQNNEATAAVPVEAQAPQDEVVELLFVQYAESASLSKGVLTLKGVALETLYFSDRPHRVVGRTPTEKFIRSWDKGAESFAKSPPNAVLAVMQKPVPLDLVVVLKNPVLEGDTLTYQVEVLDGPDSGEGEASALFIDVVEFPLLEGIGRSARETARNIDDAVYYDDDEYGESYDADFSDPGDRDAYRSGYKDGRRDFDYDDD